MILFLISWRKPGNIFLKEALIVSIICTWLDGFDIVVEAIDFTDMNRIIAVA